MTRVIDFNYTLNYHLNYMPCKYFVNTLICRKVKTLLLILIFQRFESSILSSKYFRELQSYMLALKMTVYYNFNYTTFIWVLLPAQCQSILLTWHSWSSTIKTICATTIKTVRGVMFRWWLQLTYPMNVLKI